MNMVFTCKVTTRKCHAETDKRSKQAKKWVFLNKWKRCSWERTP